MYTFAPTDAIKDNGPPLTVGFKVLYIVMYAEMTSA